MFSPTKTLYFLSILACVLFLGNISCQKDPTGIESKQNPVTDPDYIPEGSWVTYSPYKWTHDGHPAFGDYCIAYSDCCGYQFKEQVVHFADAKFEQVLNLFDFNEIDEMLYPMDYEKVDVYINRYHPQRIAAAYWGTIIITFSSENIYGRHDYLFRHELTHVFQFLIEGHVNLSTPVWFTEAIAIYGGGGLWGIRDTEDLDHWIAMNVDYPDKGNPICINIWDDFPPEADISGYYYYVFDLTMRYFLDPDGMNRSIDDVLRLFYDLRNEIPFETSFEAHFGIDVVTFEQEYYSRMYEYLAGN